MTEPVAAALTAAEWAAVLAQEDELLALRAGMRGTAFSPHAVAALLLFQQPFGFTADDVLDEREVAAYCEAMASRHATEGDEKTAASFRHLAVRHRGRAERIAALLPPTDDPSPPGSPG